MAYRDLAADPVPHLSGEVVVIARGGFYGSGSPMAPLEHAESCLRGAFGFLGISEPEVSVAEGLNTGPDQREGAIKAALDRIAAL